MSTRFLRSYLYVLMGGLLLQGLGSLLFRLQPSLAAAAPWALRGLFGIDFWHSWIHIAWGAGAVGLLAVHHSRRFAAATALVFGMFYTAFGVLGLVTHHPFGLQLGLLETGFHLVAGPVTLLIGLASSRSIATPDLAAGGT